MRCPIPFVFAVAACLAGCTGAQLPVEPKAAGSRASYIAEWPGVFGKTHEAWFIFSCVYGDSGTSCRPLGAERAAPEGSMIALVPEAPAEELDDGARVRAYYRAEDARGGPPPAVYARVCPPRGACYWLISDYERVTGFGDRIIAYVRRNLGELLHGASATAAYLQHEMLDPVLERLAP